MPQVHRTPNTVNKFTDDARIQVPLICGAMYPCSNPELVAAASEAGGIGIIQPLSLVYAHKYDYMEGLAKIRSLTSKPVGFNAIIEKSSKIYLDRMKHWIQGALTHDIKFFVTALGNPDWVVKMVHSAGGIVYHDVTALKWAKKALSAGVDGLICVNSRAGGHAGAATPQELHAELSDLGVPLICAGGIGSPTEFAEALNMGYAGVQMGTRFIATRDCTAHGDYKKAIVEARQDDIVLTDKISGVPVSVIKTAYVVRVGTQAGPIARWMLRGNRTKHWMRMFYSLRSLRELSKSSRHGGGYRDYYQAGKSVETIHEVESTAEVIAAFAAAVEPMSVSA